MEQLVSQPRVTWQMIVEAVMMDVCWCFSKWWSRDVVAWLGLRRACITAWHPSSPAVAASFLSRLLSDTTCENWHTCRLRRCSAAMTQPGNTPAHLQAETAPCPWLNQVTQVSYWHRQCDVQLHVHWAVHKARLAVQSIISDYRIVRWPLRHSVYCSYIF